MFLIDYTSLSSLIFILFFFSLYGDLRDLHSFPTRRSSDLVGGGGGVDGGAIGIEGEKTIGAVPRAGVLERSEEHTSELQSHSDLVCRLLLEKKKVIILNVIMCI